MAKMENVTEKLDKMEAEQNRVWNAAIEAAANRIMEKLDWSVYACICAEEIRKLKK